MCIRDRLIGGLVIILSIFRLPKAPVKQTITMEYWLLLGTIMSVIIGLKCLTGLSFNLRGLGTFIATLIAALFVSLVITPLIIDLKNK